MAFGADGRGWIASDSLGGTIDLLTLAPSQHDTVVIQQGFGNERRALTSLRATGTIDKLAYSATSWADKTGEGDNDFNPAAYMLSNVWVGQIVALSARRDRAD